MRIAVTASAASLEAEVDPRFGRCPCFVIVETDDLSFERIDNQNASLGGGAGIQSAQLMAEKGVQYVLTGNCGPNAYRTLSAAGIGVVVGCSGSVRQAVEKFKSGAYAVADQPSVGGHFGTGGGGAGQGMRLRLRPPPQVARRRPGCSRKANWRRFASKPFRLSGNCRRSLIESRSWKTRTSSR